MEFPICNSTARMNMNNMPRSKLESSPIVNRFLSRKPIELTMPIEVEPRRCKSMALACTFTVSNFKPDNDSKAPQRPGTPTTRGRRRWNLLRNTIGAVSKFRKFDINSIQNEV